MKPRELLDFLRTVETLKTNTRHSITSGGVLETVAAHSWRLAVMALLVAPEIEDIDREKVIRMCLIHDFGEAVTGDIPSFEKSEANEQAEGDAVLKLLSQLPDPQQEELSGLFEEMNAQETKESRLYKALDKLEAVIQHNESDIKTWIPLEYQLNVEYGTENAAEFPFLRSLREIVREDTKRKIEQAEGENDS